MAYRRFVLVPAAAVAAAMVHPQFGWTIGQLLNHLSTAPPYVAVAGLVDSDKTALVEKVLEKTPARWIRRPELANAPAMPGTDPAVLYRDRLLEFFREAAELLNRAGWMESEQPAVSDFWLPEPLALLGPLPDEAAEAVRQACAQAAKAAAAPKLIVLLETTPRKLPQQSVEHLAAIQSLSAALAEQVLRPGQGPWLRLAADDLTLAADEVAAAVTAMEST